MCVFSSRQSLPNHHVFADLSCLLRSITLTWVRSLDRASVELPLVPTEMDVNATGSGFFLDPAVNKAGYPRYFFGRSRAQRWRDSHRIHPSPPGHTARRRRNVIEHSRTEVPRLRGGDVPPRSYCARPAGPTVWVTRVVGGRDHSGPRLFVWFSPTPISGVAARRVQPPPQHVAGRSLRAERKVGLPPRLQGATHVGRMPTGSRA